MVVTSVLSTEAEMDAMAGENIDTTGWTDNNRTAWGIQAEGYLNLISRYDFVTNVGTLASKTKAILSEYVARYTAASGILFNTAGFTTIVEAEDMVSFHVYRMEKIESWIKDQKQETFIKKT